MSKRQKFCLPAPHSKELRSRAGDLYKSGKSYQEIAEITKLPLSTLRNWCKRHGWKLAKPDQIEPTVTTALDEPIEIPGSLAEKQAVYTDHMSAAAVRLAQHVSKLDGESLVKAADKLLKSDQMARKALKLETEKPFCAIQIGVLASPQAGKLHSLVRPQKALSETES